jgi:hypothetical protein
MYGRFLGPLIALMLWQSCVWAAPTPFAAPGGRQGSTKFPPNSVFRPRNIPQRPQRQEDYSKDVEFRGYFYLNGMPRFCVYNVDAQFSEWITLGEATYEEFNASGFNLESETLTVIYKNQSFNLNLYGPTSSPPSSPPSRSAPPHPRTSSKAPSPSQPKRMPPVPKFVPQLPAAITSATPSAGIPTRQQITASGKRVSPPSPHASPVFPGPMIPRPLAGPSNPVSPSNPTQPLSSNPSSATAPARTFAPTPSAGLTTAPTTNPSTNTGAGTEIDFSNLPPPPPPPNILPPSAPPNIEPSRETE